MNIHKTRIGLRAPLNCEVYSSFEREFSHHKIVLAKIQLSLRRNKKQAKFYDMTVLYLPMVI